MESLRGQILLASPALADPNFQRTVVLVGEHSPEGAMGLILNRPSQTSVSEGLPELEELDDGGSAIFVGGPVAPSVIMVLARFREPEDSEAVVGEHIGFLPAGTELAQLSETALETRVFAGYAGWGPEQLEGEIDSGDWIVHEPVESDVFSEHPEELWSTVLTRMGGRFALLARMPPDPSVN